MSELSPIQKLNLSDIWKDLVRLENVAKVARKRKVESDIAKLKSQYAGLDSEDLLYEASRMTQAIRKSKNGAPRIPADVVEAIEAGFTFSAHKDGNNYALRPSTPLVAAWYSLATTRFDGVPECDFCGGINVARAKARFCSEYCRDKFHKRETRSR